MRALMLAALAACSGSTSCGGDTGKLFDAAGNAVIDCVKKDPIGTAKLMIKLGKTLYELKDGGELNWNGFIAQAIAFEKDNGCAAAFTVDAFKPIDAGEAASRSLLAQPDPSRDALERVREHFGGVRWKLDGKTI